MGCKWANEADEVLLGKRPRLNKLRQLKPTENVLKKLQSENVKS